MKKLLLLVAASSLLVLGSCNKNKKFNKTLDGIWTVTVKDGQVVSPDNTTKFTFMKDASDDGDVTMIVYKDGAQDSQATGTYKITDGGKTLAIDATGTTSGSNPGAFTFHSSGKITSQTDTKFTYNTTITTSAPALGGLGVTETTIVEVTKQ